MNICGLFWSTLTTAKGTQAIGPTYIQVGRIGKLIPIVQVTTKVIYNPSNLYICS